MTWIVGTSSTAFDKHPDRTFRDLTREVVLGAIADAGVAGEQIEQIWFGNCAMDRFGQSNIRGQVCLSPLQEEGVLRRRAPIANVEAGCATGSLAFHAAVKHVRAGGDLALAVGVEKTFVPDDPVKTFSVFDGGIDQQHPEEWRSFFAEQAATHGEALDFHPHRVMFLDIHALQARHHMTRYGTTVAQIAAGASKNHAHGALNDKAQYRFTVDVEAVLADRPVVAPLTRSMCAPISDGAVAVLVCSDRFLDQHPSLKARAVKVRASALSGGCYRDLTEDTLVHYAAQQAYEESGIGPEAIQIAEVHDATSFCEILHLEMLGLVPRGEGGAFVASGAASLGGLLPVNVSGGLVSKGHPLAATGLSMIDELVLQLRSEAGGRQVLHQGAPPRYGLQQNAGGLIGWDEAMCSVAVLERPGA